MTAKIRDHGISVRQLAKLLETSYRRLYYAINCDYAVKRRRVTKAVAHELGVTSLGILAPFLTKSSATNAELFEIARTTKSNDLLARLNNHVREEPHEPRSLMALQPTTGSGR